MQQFKAKDKITQKMTRDGVVETNKATGEQTRTSSREAETDYTEKSTAEKVIDKSSYSAGKRKAGKQAKKATKENKQAEKALTVKIPVCIFPRKNVPTRICKRQSVNQKRQRTGWIRQRRISPNRNALKPPDALMKQPGGQRPACTLKNGTNRQTGSSSTIRQNDLFGK